MVVGRAGERRQIDALLDGARNGTSRVLVLRGDAGIGKSTLLAHARERATGMQVLEMRGVEGEADLAFAGLTDLLLPVGDELDRIPRPQADALRTALALGAEPANPLTVRVGLLTLLAALAERQPVLVTVDDVQWIDRSSIETLAFAARRLAAERVAVLAAARGAERTPLDIDAAAAVTVEGLADDEARELLTERAGLSGVAADELIRTASGNPLALLELPELAGSASGPGGVEPPPVGPRVLHAFADRLERLPSGTKLAVGVVAADPAATRREIADTLHQLGLPADALEPAEAEGLLTVGADRVELRHALLRSVVYHALSGPDRREVHGALAKVLDRPRSSERQVWHRAEATLGLDEAVATALEQAARSAERRGALATAAHGLDRAASLSPDDDDRARRLLGSADAWLAAGHWDLALDQLDRASDFALDPGLRADIAASTGQLEAYRSGPERGGAILVDAAERIEHDDPVRATRLYSYAVNVAASAIDIDRAVTLATRAAECGTRAGGLSVLSGTMATVEAGLFAGDADVGTALAPLAHLADGLIDSDLADAEQVFSLVVLADFVRESWDRAERLLDVMEARARATGRLFLLAFSLVIRSELDWRRGRWTEAYTRATTDVWETPLDLPWVGSWLHAVQARIEAGLGLTEEAREHGQAALAAATATGTHAVEAWAGASLGFLELGQARPQAAVEHLTAVAELLERGRVAEPGVLWYAPDLIEAHWRLGQVGPARRALEILRAQAEATGRTWARAAARRAEGLLAPTPSAAEDAFADALAWHDRLPAPFERARTLLLLGERRLSFGRPDAGAPLQEAQAAFEHLAARPWIAQVRALTGDDAAPDTTATLTRQERRVAAVVGGGATNREAADQLFLSPRTIDFHLRNIYQKLDIRSRTELAVHIAGQ